MKRLLFVVTVLLFGIIVNAVDKGAKSAVTEKGVAETKELVQKIKHIQAENKKLVEKVKKQDLEIDKLQKDNNIGKYKVEKGSALFDWLCIIFIVVSAGVAILTVCVGIVTVIVVIFQFKNIEDAKKQIAKSINLQNTKIGKNSTKINSVSEEINKK